MKMLFVLLLALGMAWVPGKKKDTYILVHGAWHGAWSWKHVTPIMDKMGLRSIAVELPGSGMDSSKAARIKLNDYVTEVVRIARQQNGRVILVGHSMAGVIISQAAEELGPEKVSNLVFLDAFMPRDGESVFDLAGIAASNPSRRQTLSLLDCLEFSSGQKVSRVKTEIAKSLFYQDCTNDDVSYALEHLGWQPMAPLATPVHVTESRYGAIPKYYILCAASNDLDKTALTNHVPCKKIVTLESGHSPFFSMPQELVNVFADL